jgi:hypothetical protein
VCTHPINLMGIHLLRCAKERSFCNQHLVDQFFPLAIEVFNCLHKHANVNLTHNRILKTSFFVLTMDLFWNLVVFLKFSFSYPYGNNHKRLYEALSQSHEKPIVIQHVSCIFYQVFGQEFMKNFMYLIPKSSFLTKCKIGGIILQWMMVAFHQ